MTKKPGKRQLGRSLCVLALGIVLADAPAEAQQRVKIDSVGSGLVAAEYQLPGPVRANVVTVDLSDTSLHVVAFQAPGLVPTSRQVQVLVDEGKRVLAAMNADFFSFKTGWPVGNTVVDGELLLGLRSKRSHLVISGRSKPYIERVTFVGFVVTSRGDIITLGGLNNGIRSEQARLYSPALGDGTSEDTVGVKILLRRLSGPTALGDTVWYLVSGRLARGRAMIPMDGAVLAVPDDILGRTGGGFLTNDTLAVVTDLVPFVPDARQVLGGAGRILRDGECDTVDNYAKEDLPLSFQATRHPRTFVGFDRDTTRIFLCTVDGRQAQSRGMNFSEMAEFLQGLGAWNAVNLDGGGSTTMVVEGAIVNVPSDSTGERPVANIIAVIRTP